MNIDKIAHLKRTLESSIKKNNDEESIKLLNELIKNYYKNLEICEHKSYCHNGYYKFHNNEICKVDKGDAEFRSIVCPICSKEIIILKTEKTNWDTEIFGQKFPIVSPLKFNHKKINLNLLTPSIIDIMNEYYNFRQEYCGHLEFINNGYYTFNKTLERSTRGRADFRIVTCTLCNKSYYIPKSMNKYWDVSIYNNPISVYDADDKKSKQYIITM